MRIKLMPLFVLAALLMTSCRPATLTPTVTSTLVDIPAFTPAASPVVVETLTTIPTPTLTDVPLPALTAIPTLTPTNVFTPDPILCAWTMAYGDTDKLTYDLEQAFIENDISGTVETRSYGENGGSDCDYHEMYLTVTMTVYVADTTDLPALTEWAAQIEKILQSQVSPHTHQPSLAEEHSTLTFKGVTGSAAKVCLWQFSSSMCQYQQ